MHRTVCGDVSHDIAPFYSRESSVWGLQRWGLPIVGNRVGNMAAGDYSAHLRAFLTFSKCAGDNWPQFQSQQNYVLTQP